MTLSVPKEWKITKNFKSFLEDINRIIKIISIKEEETNLAFIRFYKESDTTRHITSKKYNKIEKIISRYGKPRKFHRDKEKRWTIRTDKKWPVYLTKCRPKNSNYIYEIWKPQLGKKGFYIDFIKVSDIFLRKQFNIENK